VTAQLAAGRPTGRTQIAAGVVLALWAGFVALALIVASTALTDDTSSPPYLLAGVVVVAGWTLTLLAILIALTGLARQRPWGRWLTIAALWLVVLLGAVEIVRQLPALHIPFLGIGAAIVLILMPREARSLRLPQRPADRRLAVALAGLFVLAVALPHAAPLVARWTSGWSSMPALRVGLNRPSAAISDGYIYVVGEAAEQAPRGWAGSEFVQLLDVGNHPRVSPPDNGWSIAAWQYLPERRLASDGGPRVFILDRDGTLLIYDSPTLDPAAPPDEWKEGVLRTDLPPLPAQDFRYGAALAVGADGRLYVFGGDGIVAGEVGFLRSVDVFDPVTEQWSRPAPMIEGRSGAAAVAASDGLIYVFGGTSDGDHATGSVAIYDPTTDSWRSESAVDDRADHAVVEGADGRFYLFGGFAAGTSEPALDVGIYDRVTQGWTRWPAQGDDPRPFAAAVTAPDGRIYLIGGGGARGVETSRGVDVLKVGSR
jgi:N-acetylneuraminic acid mutarotase